MRRRNFLIGSALTPIVPRSAFSRSGQAGGVDGLQIDTLNSIGGSLKNGFGTWSFGPMITPPTAAGPPGPFGVYCYVRLNGVNLNVNDIVPSTSAIHIGYGGNVFFLTTQNDRWWFQFVGYNANAYFVGSPFIDPSSVVFSPPPPANFAPPYTPSADGTAISRPSASSLTTREGIWTFTTGRMALNGVPLNPPGDASDMKVSAGGRLFAKLISDGNWYAYLNYQFFSVGGSVPTLPFPAEIVVTPNFKDLLATTPINTVVATVSITTSDGSNFFSSGGVLNQADAGWLGFSGANLIVTSSPPPSTIVLVQVLATLNGVTTHPGASVIEIRVS